jgi:hypothetical protein
VMSAAMVAAMWRALPGSVPVAGEHPTLPFGYQDALESAVQLNTDPLALEVIRLRHQLRERDKQLQILTEKSDLSRVLDNTASAVPFAVPAQIAALQSSPSAPKPYTAPSSRSLAPPLSIEAKQMLPTGEKVSPTNTETLCSQNVIKADEDRNVITIYVQNPRTGSLFMSGRLARWSSGKYTYRWVRTKELSPRPTADLKSWFVPQTLHNTLFTPLFRQLLTLFALSPLSSTQSLVQSHLILRRC